MTIQYNTIIWNFVVMYNVKRRVKIIQLGSQEKGFGDMKGFFFEIYLELFVTY